MTPAASASFIPLFSRHVFNAFAMPDTFHIGKHVSSANFPIQAFRFLHVFFIIRAAKPTTESTLNYGPDWP